MADRPTAEPVPRLALRPAEAAESLGISKRALDELILDLDSGLKIVRVGRAVLLPIDGLREWLQERST